jgi:MoaA/NifB/PqqE/SkfB family radical SAM enzyme
MEIGRLSFEKLFYHTEHLNRFMTTGDTTPVHCIVGFTTYCNHRCVWCYAGYAVEDPRHNVKTDPETLLEALREMRENGLKSVSLVGEGEPLIHPQAAEMIRRIAELGIEIGIYTNGVHLDGANLDALLDCARFVRLSFNGSTPQEYARIHQTPEEDFHTVVANARELLRRRRDRRFPTLGAQCVINQDNFDAPYRYAGKWKGVGADYVAFKPAYKNEINREHEANQVQLDVAIESAEKALALADDRFQVYVKTAQFRQLLAPPASKGCGDGCAARTDRGYGRCFGQTFVTSLTATGDMYVCGNLTGRPEYLLGNVKTDGGFLGVWNGDRRRKVVAYVDADIDRCPVACRLDPLNRLLWDLKHPDPKIHPAFL